MIYLAFLSLLATGGLGLFFAFCFRTVVSTNIVHIVQSSKKTTPYGTGQAAGNVYYKIPAFVPVFGVTVIELPVSNFDISLNEYQAYDKERVPFLVNVVAFFRIVNTEIAAKRIQSFDSLLEQLSQIVQGAIRKVLADAEIDDIMLKRAQFGASFSAEVEDQLAEWGVESVKSMELMDIDDVEGNNTIKAIMDKKISFIEMESRKEVAANHQAAEMAEIEAKREVKIQEQQALEVIGQRTAEKERNVGLAQQKTQQEVLAESATTKKREMEVASIAAIRQAEIAREQAVVQADAARQQAQIAAEADKQVQVIAADAALEKQRRDAQAVEVAAIAALVQKEKEAAGTLALGLAKADSEKALQLASVTAQTELAKEIGGNAAYQDFLIRQEQVKAGIEVGVAQAAALEQAEVKILVSSDNAADGMSQSGNVFGPGLGQRLAGTLEGLAQSPVGRAVVEKLVGTEAA